MNKSRWRDRSVRVIAETEATLPQGCTRKQARKILGRAYPFGSRKGHPYKMWLSEVRKFLDAKFREIHHSLRVDPRFDCAVMCEWCNNRFSSPLEPEKGCLVCIEVRRRFSDLANTQPDVVDRWRRWATEAAKDEDESLILADWLDDVVGFPEEAQAIRDVGMKRLPRRVRVEMPCVEDEESDECPF